MPMNWTSLVKKSMIAVIIWLVLIEGDPRGIWFGIPMVISTVAVSIKMRSTPPPGWTFIGFWRFIPFFVVQSVIAGIDVAVRALRRRMPINPWLIDFPLRLTHAPACIFLANIISLLPGTLTAEIHSNILRIHVLAWDQAQQESLRLVEEKVAQLYGIQLDRGTDVISGN